MFKGYGVTNTNTIKHRDFAHVDTIHIHSMHSVVFNVLLAVLLTLSGKMSQSSQCVARMPKEFAVSFFLRRLLVAALQMFRRTRS